MKSLSLAVVALLGIHMAGSASRTAIKIPEVTTEPCPVVDVACMVDPGAICTPEEMEEYRRLNEYTPSKSLPKDFEDLEKDFKKVQEALSDFVWLVRVVKGNKQDKVLYGQLEALKALLKDELDPVMKTLGVDAWIIGNQQKMSQGRHHWSIDELLRVCREFEDATWQFGFDLTWLLGTLNHVKKTEGILEQLDINEKRFRESVKELSKVYTGEWSNLYKNIRNRVQDIIKKAIKKEKGVKME